MATSLGSIGSLLVAFTWKEPGTLERRVLLRSFDVRDAGKQRSHDDLCLHGCSPQGQARSDDHTGSLVRHHTSQRQTIQLRRAKSTGIWDLSWCNFRSAT